MLHSRPHWGAYSAPQTPIAGFRGKGPRERDGETGGKGRERGEGERREGRG